MMRNVRSAAALLAALASADVASATLAKSLPTHQLHALKSLVARELEEKWANAETAEWASHLCEHNDSYAWDLGNSAKLPLIGAVAIGDSPTWAAQRGAEEGERPPALALGAGAAADATGGLESAELQAAHLDLMVMRWRVDRSAQPWRQAAAAAPAEANRPRQLRPVSVSFAEPLDGHVLQRPVARPEKPLVRSLASLRATLA